MVRGRRGYIDFNGALCANYVRCYILFEKWKMIKVPVERHLATDSRVFNKCSARVQRVYSNKINDERQLVGWRKNIVLSQYISYRGCFWI